MLGRRAILALSVALLSCVAPTLPLPPPEQPQVSPGADASTFHLSSAHGAQPNAIVVIVNRDPAIPPNKRVSGAQADNGGSWSAEVTAQPGDFVDVTQEIGTSRSPSISVHIPAR